MDENLCDLFIEELRLLKQVKKIMIFGFCIMPDHIHLLIQSNIQSSISKDIQFLKRHFSRNANIIMGFSEGAIGQSRLRGEFNNIDAFIKLYKNKMKNNSYPKFAWQKSFHDHHIRNHNDFEKHLNYINTNHLKHGLPNNWKYIGYNYNNLLDL